MRKKRGKLEKEALGDQVAAEKSRKRNEQPANERGVKKGKTGKKKKGDTEKGVGRKETIEPLKN